MKNFLLVVIGAAAGALLVFLITRWGPAPSVPALAIDRTQAGVVAQLRNFKKLTTATSTVEQMAETGDKQTVVIRGKTIAGFDLSDLPAENVIINAEGGLFVQLSTPQVFGTEVDGRSTKIFDSKTKTFDVKDILPNDMFKSISEKAARAGACQAEILTRATENMETMLQAYFQGMGFQDVTFRTPAGQCM